MRRSAISVSLLAIALLGVTAACSSDSETSTAGTTEPPTTEQSTSTSGAAAPPADEKQALIQQADAICTDLTKKVAALAIDLNATNTADVAKQADAIDQSTTYTKDALAQLRALPVPAGDEATVTGFWDQVEQQIPVNDQIAASIRANDLAGAQQAARQLRESGQQVNAQLAQYGFVACSK